jgi:hypothetical protein
MFLTELKKFEKYIDSYTIAQFEQNGNNLRFRMTINFKNSTRLFIKEILIDGTKRKYGYQWIDKDDELICRWDNAPDWPNIPTFPITSIFKLKIMFCRPRISNFQPS